MNKKKEEKYEEVCGGETFISPEDILNSAKQEP